MPRCVLLFVFSLLLPQAWVSAAEDPTVWLERLAQAGQTRAYEAVIVHQRGDSLRSVKLTHRVENGQVHEHWQALDQNLPDLQREHDRLQCVRDNCRQRQALPTLLRAFLPQDVLQHYSWQVAPTPVRIAGREGLQWQLRARDDWRHGQRLVVDRETGLLLALETLDASDRVLERFRMVSLNWLPVEGVAPAIAAPVKTAVVQEPAPAWLPPGFQAVATGSGQQVYSDGLATFSVFDGEATEAEAEIVLQRGATVLYARSLPVGEGFRQFTVVGEIPVLAARRLATALASEAASAP